MISTQRAWKLTLKALFTPKISKQVNENKISVKHQQMNILDEKKQEGKSPEKRIPKLLQLKSQTILNEKVKNVNKQANNTLSDMLRALHKSEIKEDVFFN